ncbi:hypothetical protein F383_29441 [Gossypium arboreum]|uniref:Uncharacterized protein n=1 Tax=Gossypium arboreum TaxID=29729 RepID=A0A0B0PHJ2_GOSAR|nr:hypothetical protein F383_29441 [Gossypium arboreum]
MMIYKSLFIIYFMCIEGVPQPYLFFTVGGNL